MDRRTFLAAVGGAGVVELMSPAQKAEALEAAMVQELDGDAKKPRMGSNAENDELPPMPAKPTLVDFYRLRFAPARHVLQSAAARPGGRGPRGAHQGPPPPPPF